MFLECNHWVRRQRREKKLEGFEFCSWRREGMMMGGFGRRDFREWRCDAAGGREVRS